MEDKEEVMKFRKLKADEIELKVGNVNRRGYTLLLYKNARVDMQVLDETVGAENWQNKFYEVVGNLYCSVGINVNFGTDKDERWIWKDDCGSESDFGDKEKGQASDARKRAGFAWGIGRELYTAPSIFIECETESVDGRHYKIKNYADERKANSMRVEKIDYIDDKISSLVITDNKGEITFTFGDYETLTQGSGCDYVLNGGKYDGEKLGYVYHKDREYLNWCLGNCKSQVLIMNIKKCFEQNGEVIEQEV